MSQTNEWAFETAIEDHLLRHGYDRLTASDWNRELALCPDVITSFLQDTQPDEWQRLVQTYGADTEKSVIREIAKQLDRHGMLHVLRQGIRDRGIHYRLCFFKPATTLNPETVRLYGLNRLGIMRQVEFDLDSHKSIDTVLFINGLPVATVELKNAFTGQTTMNAITQYIRDRRPTKRTPLIEFKKRAPVHFAVDTDEVYMTTRLAGEDTVFLPFNQGCDGGKGNPVNPTGYKTAYLWERLWERECWLNIFHRFVSLERKERTDKGTGRKDVKETIIFPRYHQWDAVTQIVDESHKSGPGRNYLAQHSAGSGKTNTISWLAHQLATLHDANNNPIFDAVIVVSDRRNIDRQLQDNIFQVEHKQGVVELIQPRDGQSKSALLSTALNRGARIIVSTLQTFSHVMGKDLGDLSHRCFAIIADEAHSSQTGKSAANLRIALSAGASEEAQLQAAAEADILCLQEPDPEEEILKIITARGPQKNLSYYAFTATPKKKTVELFGQRGEDGQPHAFHYYTMRQAIEEGFILDVLKYYTTYKSYFHLTKKIQEDPAHEKTKSRKAIARFVRFHGHILDQKTEVMLEHFRTFVRHKIGGQAKAMVVTSSRLHAVRYKQAFDRYLDRMRREQPRAGWEGIKVLVAFSQSVVDPDDETISYTETGMNTFPESETAERFDTGEYQLLIVAEKYQTGYDQPKLHTMYVDKPFKDLQAVQTLSRLNRIFPGKVDTLVIDFVNEVEDVREAFIPYYQRPEIDAPSDPNLIYEIHTKVMSYGVIWERDIEEFATIFFKPVADRKKTDHAALNRIVDPAVHRFHEVFVGEHKDQGDVFKKLLRSFIRYYSFITQLCDLQDVMLEKFYAYAELLLSKLRNGGPEDALDLSAEIRLESYRNEKTFEGSASLGPDDTGELTGIGNVASGATSPEQVLLPLSEILDEFNERHGTNFTRTDMLFADQAMQDLQQNDKLVEQARNNTLANFRPVFEEAVLDAFWNRRDRNQTIVDELMGNDAALAALTDIMLRRFQNAAVGVATPP